MAKKLKTDMELRKVELAIWKGKPSKTERDAARGLILSMFAGWIECGMDGRVLAQQMLDFLMHAAEGERQARKNPELYEAMLERMFARMAGEVDH